MVEQLSQQPKLALREEDPFARIQTTDEAQCLQDERSLLRACLGANKGSISKRTKRGATTRLIDLPLDECAQVANAWSRHD